MWLLTIMYLGYFSYLLSTNISLISLKEHTMVKIMSGTPVVMTIAGSDSGGGAGLEADIKTFAALGVHGTCAITSVTAQNTRGVLSIYDLPLHVISEQINAVCSDMDVKWAKTGMLSCAEIIALVSKEVRSNGLSLVVDPVMAAEAGGDLLRKDAVRVLKEELLPFSKVVTPNIYEAHTLSGIDINDVNDATKAAKKIAELGVDTVVVTGGHLDASDVVYESVSDKCTVIPGKFLEGGTHGSGCTYAASITAFLSKGYSIVEAAMLAKSFVEKAIMNSEKVGHGVGPVNQLGSILKASYRYDTLLNTNSAAEILVSCDEFGKLIPEVGCNIAMAIPEATVVADVAGVSGRIVRVRDRPYIAGNVEFGGSKHVASMVIAAMESDQSLRAAVNLRYSEKVLHICRGIGLTISSFDRDVEAEQSEMTDLDVVSAINNSGSALLKKVPDIIYDKGCLGKEPMIRLFGKSAVEVAYKAVEIARLYSGIT
ncbi:phosphomethylpyrimidine kinase [Methanomethylovorans hollandica DSM 15978]|uniref:Phosphomethylpyrimidine kinase n=2 Tax=Methanomethylovorans hollandica TaxID=101192 RepID=L0KYA9_METHD|nr:phosphomethylpyrimidine kinase [Methanomethylovorans hollandica DSM 15978]